MKGERQLLAILSRENKTIPELAKMLNVSYDTARQRVNELRLKKKVRVAGWVELKTTMVRTWGIGSQQDEPRPVRVKVKIKKSHPQLAVSVRECPKKVVFRREVWDDWMFRVRRVAA